MPSDTHRLTYPTLSPNCTMSATLDVSWRAGGIPPVVNVGRRAAELVMDAFLSLLEQLFHLLAFAGEILTIVFSFAAWATSQLRLNRPFYRQLFGVRVVRPLQRRSTTTLSFDRLTWPEQERAVLGYDVAVQTAPILCADASVQVGRASACSIDLPIPPNRTPANGETNPQRVVAPSFSTTIGSAASPYQPEPLHLTTPLARDFQQLSASPQRLETMPRLSDGLAVTGVPARSNVVDSIDTVRPVSIPPNAEGWDDGQTSNAQPRRSRRSSARVPISYR